MDLSSLPPSLAERARWIRAPKRKAGRPIVGIQPSPAGPSASGEAAGFTGELVLYWMHHAVRAHENPSLDVAIRFAAELGKPLLVYHALSEHYPYASDRHHAFILQGARDVQREMSDRGIAYVFHLQREGHRGPHLRDLARRAAVVISDDMPLEPVTGWLERLQTLCDVPILCVDSSCVVPLPLVPQAHTRAFAYRDATKTLYADRLNRSYVEQPIDCGMFWGELPFPSLDLQRADLPELIARCQIDHSIAPVADTPGGSRAAYARWDAFKRNGLSGYARRRNDAADPGGVSRMSAYLHFGMVSPFRIAREASERGAEKYLEELLIWRELAYHFCHHMGESIEMLQGLPAWARATLAEHAADPRPQTLSWEAFSRGQSGDPLWDACQQSLRRHGELHNNLRMTWGKAILPWAGSPERALQIAIDLNHRYALDGRDPSSYGGLLWCFGQFDRPFQPPQPIFGEVRPRPLEEHSRRLDLKKFRGHVDRSVGAGPPHVAVVGAGIGGLIAARTLVDHGLRVRTFDKSRGPGGRMATRRTDQDWRFDHGAQYFTARSCQFCRYVRSWVEDGLVEAWGGRIVQLRHGQQVAEKGGTVRYVAKPGMNALAKHLAQELDVTLGSCVERLERTRDQRWRLIDDRGASLGEFDRVIVNCPPPQAAQLLAEHTQLTQPIRQVVMNPCWAVLLRQPRRLALDFDGAFVDDSPLAWISRDNAKPGRSERQADHWVLHATAGWSRENLEADAGWVASQLREAFAAATGVAIEELGDGVAPDSLLLAHRWRYAIPEKPLDVDCLWDAGEGLGACGDWCGGPRIEGAFLSGVAVAGALLRHWTIDRPAERMLFA